MDRDGALGRWPGRDSGLLPRRPGCCAGPGRGLNVAVELQGGTLSAKLTYYVRGQADGWAAYAWQGLWTTLMGGIPGLPGIALRGLTYRLVLGRMDGLAAIEAHVRLRHA